MNEIRSGGLLHLDTREWSTEAQIDAQELKRELGLFRQVKNSAQLSTSTNANDAQVYE
jgi:hypothetical protein